MANGSTKKEQRRYLRFTIASMPQFVSKERCGQISFRSDCKFNSEAGNLVRSYLQAGEAVDWKFIQERLGHASVVTTMQTYTHLTNEDRK